MCWDAAIDGVAQWFHSDGVRISTGQR
jgi:hypothetical protein